MKKLFLLSFIFISLQAFSQKQVLNLNDIFIEGNLYKTIDKVVDIPNTTKKDLILKFNNWGGQTFKDYSSVKTNETENQVTFKFNTSGSYYIYDSMYGYIGSMSVIGVVTFKDNKIKIELSDNGNITKIGDKYKPTFKMGTWFMNMNFNGDKSIEYNPKPGIFNYAEKRASSLLAYKTELNNIINDIVKNLSQTENW